MWMEDSIEEIGLMTKCKDLANLFGQMGKIIKECTKMILSMDTERWYITMGEFMMDNGLRESLTMKQYWEINTQIDLLIDQETETNSQEEKERWFLMQFEENDSIIYIP